MTLATKAVAKRYRNLVFMLLWRGVRVEDSTSNSDDDFTEPLLDASAAADKLVIDTMLIEWPRGSLRVWRSETHAFFPDAFRADVRALLLVTLGSLDATAAVADGHGGEAGPAACGTSAARRIVRRLQNPLSMLHAHRLLEPIFQALLHAHMGGLPCDAA